MNAKLAFIAAHRSTHSIRRLCSVLGVSRSWFHSWQTDDQVRAARTGAEADLVGQIRRIFQDSGERYGAPRIHAERAENLLPAGSPGWIRAQDIRSTAGH
jgi:putative transposase